jgi:hypothetical protein
MTWRIIIAIALLFAPLIVGGDSPAPEPQPQILQDAKTKVIYYLESDLRHVAAISPDGKLLWCRQIVRTPQNDFQRNFRIFRMEWDGDDIDIFEFQGSSGMGKLNKKTGAYSPPTITQ